MCFIQQPGGSANHCTNMTICLNFCVRIEDTHQRSVCCKHLSWNLFIGTFLALIILAFSAAFKIRHSDNQDERNKTQGNKAKAFAKQLLSDVIFASVCFSFVSCWQQQSGWSSTITRRSYSALLLTAFSCGKQ